MNDRHDRNTISNNTIQNSNVSIGDGAKQTLQPTPQHEQERSYQASSPPKQSNISPAGKPRIFLSHSSKDTAFSARLAQELYQAHGYDVWHDIERLNGGDAWWKRIQQELTARFVFLVVLSPDAVASRWVNDEIAIAWEQKNSATGKRIIPLLYRECQRSAELKTLHYISFLPPRSYQEALHQLMQAIGVPTSS